VGECFTIIEVRELAEHVMVRHAHLMSKKLKFKDLEKNPAI
jgi:hypothetical protein